MNNMNYTFEEAERELDNFFDKLITEAKTDKEKYSLKQMWNTYKDGKLREDESELDAAYERGYEDGCDYTHSQYDD